LDADGGDKMGTRGDSAFTSLTQTTGTKRGQQELLGIQGRRAGEGEGRRVMVDFPWQKGGTEVGGAFNVKVGLSLPEE